MSVKSQKSKQRIVEEKVVQQPYKYCRFAGYYLEGILIFKKHLCFLKKFPIKYQRHVGFYVLSLATYQREKFIFCELALLASFHRLLLEVINFFDYFQNSVTVKSREGYCGTKISSKLALFASFHRLPLRGTFNFSSKISEKSQQRIVGE